MKSTINRTDIFIRLKMFQSCTYEYNREMSGEKHQTGSIADMRRT